ncbi:MAG: NAD(+) diphosphatase [Rhodocyclaceae bacterium]
MPPDDFTPLFSSGQDTPAGALIFAMIGEELILTTTGALPQHAELALPTPHSDLVIGTYGGVACCANWWPAGTELPAALQARPMRDAMASLDGALVSIAIRAKQLLLWDRHSRYCGACGTPTEPLSGEPAKRCPACGLRDYPRLSPAAMILIRRGPDLLLARSPHFRPGMYSALAGFVEAGETVENCIHREVFEEVGLRVGSLRYFGSQSWPFPHSLMLAFHADYVGGDIVPQPGEIEHADWYAFDALPDLPSSISIAGLLIADAVRDLAAHYPPDWRTRA